MYTNSSYSSSQIDFKSLLNTPQLEAVEYCEGPSVIVAGAGSGKTRVLTYKIAYLLQHGYPAASILGLTFTNKAAKEMKERIAQLVGVELSRRLWMGTFHSIFSRILRAEAELLGFTSNFTIYDSADSKSLIKQIIKELQLDDKAYRPNNIQSQISSCKNKMISPQSYESNSEMMIVDQHKKQPQFFNIYRIYSQRCLEANAMDFDDLLYFTAILFAKHKEVLEKYQNHFQYILVDEYQDTNSVQHRIVTLLADKHHRVCAVGDDAQSIYSFRGALIDNILNFQHTYSNCKLFKLEQNYRSTQNIVNAANSLIKKNRRQIAKNVFSEQAVGDTISVNNFYSDFDEGQAVAHDIAQVVLHEKVPYEDMAILYRTNAQSRILEDALRKLGIPYRIYGGLSFYQRKEIKDVLAYLRLIVNPNDVEALRRIINYPTRGLGNTTLQKVLTMIYDGHVPALELLANPMGYGLDVNKGTATKLMAFAEMMAEFSRTNGERDAYEVANQVVLRSGIMSDVSVDTSPENLSRRENIEEFLNAVHEFCEQRANEGNDEVKLVNFLSEVSLLTDQDNDKENDRNVVTLMTVHAAKGLEFGQVYVVGMEENLFPSCMSDSESNVEEERRLFYVAVTRAKNRCTITYAKSRFKNGQTQFSNPSRFIFDIDSQYLTLPPDFIIPSGGSNDWGATRGSDKPAWLNQERSTVFPKKEIIKTKPATTPQGNFKPLRQATSKGVSGAAAAQFEVGSKVAHATFGQGTVLGIEGSGDNCKAKIEFQTHGVKQLLLKYARLEKL